MQRLALEVLHWHMLPEPAHGDTLGPIGRVAVSVRSGTSDRQKVGYGCHRIRSIRRAFILSVRCFAAKNLRPCFGIRFGVPPLGGPAPEPPEGGTPKPRHPRPSRYFKTRYLAFE